MYGLAARARGKCDYGAERPFLPSAKQSVFLHSAPQSKNLRRSAVKLGLREVPEAKKSTDWNRKGKEE